MSQSSTKVVNLIEQMNFASDNLTQRFPIACLAVSTKSEKNQFEEMVKAFECVARKEKEENLFTFWPVDPKEGQHFEQSLTLFVLGLAMNQKFAGTRTYLFMTNPLQELINEEVENPYFHRNQIEHDKKLKQWLRSESFFRVDPVCLHPLQMAGFAVQIGENPVDIPASNLKLLHEEMKNWEVTSAQLQKAAGV